MIKVDDLIANELENTKAIIWSHHCQNEEHHSRDWEIPDREGLKLSDYALLYLNAKYSRKENGVLIFEGEERYLYDIFPCGFNEISHEEEKHGASCKQNSPVVRWGIKWTRESNSHEIISFRLFARTQYSIYSSKVSGPAFNTCAAMDVLDQPGNSPWKSDLRDTEYITRHNGNSHIYSYHALRNKVFDNYKDYIIDNDLF